MYVLNYERTANQIFNSENSFLSDKGNIMLGIGNKNLEYRTNEAGNVVCFVQEGDLYSYDTANDEIIKVFSFRELVPETLRVLMRVRTGIIMI